MAKKVARGYEMREVAYSEGKWNTLRALRHKAITVMESLGSRGIDSIVHGSLARGDVSARSDIDILIPQPILSLNLESALSGAGYSVAKREVTQATPLHVVKGIIHISEELKVTFPLMPLRGRERDFYRFGGETDLEGLKAGRRVPGVDKRLMLIIPTAAGHVEFSVLDNVVEAARIIGVKVETIMERVRVLKRRDEVGRTGIYWKEELSESESFEGALKERSSKDPSLRRLLQRRGCGLKY